MLVFVWILVRASRLKSPILAKFQSVDLVITEGLGEGDIQQTNAATGRCADLGNGDIDEGKSVVQSEREADSKKASTETESILEDGQLVKVKAGQAAVSTAPSTSLALLTATPRSWNASSMPAGEGSSLFTRNEVSGLEAAIAKVFHVADSDHDGYINLLELVSD